MHHPVTTHRLFAGTLAALLFLLSGATAQTEETKMITDVLKDAKQKLAPDRRIAVFDVQGEPRGDAVVLTGEIQSAEMKRALVALFKEHGVNAIADSLTALPQASLGGKSRGVVSVSVANIRSKPDHSAEMATQALLGTPLKILKKEHGWYYVQTPDEYLGWTDDDIQVMTPADYEAWVARPKIIVTTEVSSVRASKESGSQQIGDIVAGCILALKKDARTHFEVEYPDARTGYVRKKDAAHLDAYLARVKATQKSIVATAKRFIGIPYFWGGTSPKALDCSGFSKTVYSLNGIQLPRDASQQALVGEPLDTTDGLNFQPGDLLFFGAKATGDRKERVTHVAISVGGKRFLHASGQVRYNSFDSKDPDFSEYRLKAFLRARRIIGAPESSGVRFLTHIPYYIGTP
jgi:gamma-D-glutamyl-L-lysine dipeptidyl-peptidase